MTENLNNDEESRLIERLILGEEKAFCKLYVQYKPRFTGHRTKRIKRYIE